MRKGGEGAWESELQSRVWLLYDTFLIFFVLCIAYCRCYQFKYDSTHGRYKGTVEFDDKSHHLIVDGRKIKVYMHPDPTKIPWSEEDVDIVIESSGV